MTEIEFQSMWFNGIFGNQFQDQFNNNIKIISFGNWNFSHGPDFTNCKVEINQKTHIGDIEIDPKAKDWENHSHHKNKNFNSVILHVTYTTEYKNYFPRNQENKKIHQINIKINKTKNKQNYKKNFPKTCQIKFSSLNENQKIKFLQEIATNRLIQKAQLIKKITHFHSPENTLFFKIASALGYSKNSIPLEIIAQKYPPQKKFYTAHEAQKFGSAGFLNFEIYKNAQNNSKEYISKLWKLWWQSDEYYTLLSKNKFTKYWNLSAVRPFNHPHSRLSALICIEKNWQSLINLCQQKKPKLSLFYKFFQNLSHQFWSHHYSLKSKYLKKRNIIGHDRITAIISNAIAPFLYYQKNLNLNDFFTIKIKSPPKPALDFANILFKKPQTIKHASHEQALLELNKSFCQKNSKDCSICPLPKIIQNKIIPTNSPHH